MPRRALVIAFLRRPMDGSPPAAATTTVRFPRIGLRLEPPDPAKNVPADQIGKVNVIPAGSDWYVARTTSCSG
ncbi:MAG: hypothetical protein IPN07_17020 [Dehalococcoidia bacterium]|nr:hypothetical protein [Dehalococcoidia bacterium]